MAQEVKLMGAVYSAVPAILLPDSNNVMHRFDDASITTATASDVASGKVFLASDGTITTGTSSGGGGASSWTKVCEKSYQITWTSTTATTEETWSTGHSEIWTSNKCLYIRVRDTAGKRSNYFYGSDNFFINAAATNSSLTNTTNSFRQAIRYNGTVFASYGASGTGGYGLYVDTVYTDGRLRVRKRYNSTYSTTIDGTYKVEVYLLDPPTGAPFFE